MNFSQEQINDTIIPTDSITKIIEQNMMVINMDHNDIWKEKLELDKARRSKLNEFLSEYDAQIYNPAIKKIRENCKQLGHKFSFHGYNLDSSHRIYKCNYCGVSRHEENQ